MNDANRIRAAREEMSIAADALRAARSLIELQLPNDAVSRAYYAAMHHARALLLIEGLEPKSHHGVLTLLGQHMRGADRLSIESLKIFGELQDRRSSADYTAARIPLATAEALVTDAESFIVEARRILKSVGYLD